jgi:hypothetical protein
VIVHILLACVCASESRESCNYSFSGIKTQAGMVADAERLRLGMQGPAVGVSAAALDAGECVLCALYVVML